MANVKNITIRKQIPLLGKGDTLESRLRKVALRGFAQVNIYQDADIQVRHLAPANIPQQLYTPQPHVHQTYLDRIALLADLFAREGIDIFNLDHAYDYIATDGTQQTDWTMVPPVVERCTVPRSPDGSLDYAPLIGPQVQQVLAQNNWCINPQIATVRHGDPSVTTFSLINDGSHRVHAGLQNGKGITVVELSGMTPGYPYYAVPQDYSTVTVFPDDVDSADLKVNVLAPPAQKQLYRYFPSGGILTGDVRPVREGEQFV